MLSQGLDALSAAQLLASKAKDRELQKEWIIHLCDWIADNVDEVAVGRCVVAVGRLGRGTSGADVELPTPVADNRGNGGWIAPADNCAKAADSWLGRGVARPVLGCANTIAAAAAPFVDIHHTAS